LIGPGNVTISPGKNMAKDPVAQHTQPAGRSGDCMRCTPRRRATLGKAFLAETSEVRDPFVATEGGDLAEGPETGGP
jgi:hypothetical protein